MKKGEIYLIIGIVLLIAIVSSFIYLLSHASASTTLTDNYVNTTGNLHLGNIISFTLGGTIDNLVNNWIRIHSNLNVTGSGFFGNDLNVSGNVYINNSEVITDADEGWIAYNDNDYTSASPLLVSATLSNISMSNYTTIDSERPLDVSSGTAWFDGNKITPTNVGDSYLLRFKFTADPVGNGAYCETFLDVGGSTGQIPLEVFSFPKGSGVIEKNSFTVVEYAFTDWYQNGGVIQIDCPAADVDFWDIGLTVQRLSRGRVASLP